jgi:FKBP-type peptidyl-prolyl cis-trans isomerase
MHMIRRIALALTAVVALSACHSQPGKAAEKPSASPDANAAFFANNAKQPGVGPATGVPPKESDEVKVNYEGKLLNGQVFDSSFARGQPAAFPLEGLVQAWVEALQLMRPGDEWTLWVPPSMGYGDEQKGPIPPNSIMVFRIQLLDVLRH